MVEGLDEGSHGRAMGRTEADHASTTTPQRSPRVWSMPNQHGGLAIQPTRAPRSMRAWPSQGARGSPHIGPTATHRSRTMVAHGGGTGAAGTWSDAWPGCKTS